MLQVFSRATKNAKRILQIGFVTKDAVIGKQLKDFVAARDGVDMRLIQSAAAISGAPMKGISVFVYDLDPTSEASMKDFNQFMLQRPQDIPAVVLSPAVDDELVRWFLRLKVSDWIKTPLSPGELIAACGRVISATAAGKQDVKCRTFIGARGGVGATTLAVHAALIAAAKAAPAVTTCLVDLDLVAGSCADYLDLKANWQLDELIADPSRLDGHMLDLMTTSHPSGIAVLSAHRKATELFAFGEDVITRSLDVASQKYQTLVVDLPRHAESWSEGVMAGSSDLYVVTDFSVPGLKLARRLINDIKDRSSGDIKPKAIVNKFMKSLFRSGLTSSEVKDILREDLAGYVNANDKLANEAINRGIPTTAIKARNSIITDLGKILGN